MSNQNVKNPQIPFTCSSAHDLIPNEVHGTVTTHFWDTCCRQRGSYVSPLCSFTRGNITSLGDVQNKRHLLIWRHWSLTGIWQQFQSEFHCCPLSRPDSQQSPVGRLLSGKLIHQTLRHHFWKTEKAKDEQYKYHIISRSVSSLESHLCCSIALVPNLRVLTPTTRGHQSFAWSLVACLILKGVFS